jgi:hypothetical protein
MQTCGIESNATGEGKLDRKQCAAVLEAVKVCADLRDCSPAAVDGRFTTRKDEFEGMTGDSGFTLERLKEQCAQTCQRKAYQPSPVRHELCGY